MYEQQIKAKMRQIADLEEIGGLQARVVGLRSEVEFLRRKGEPPERPADRTERILALLRVAGGPMRLKELIALLEQSEPGVDDAAVRATPQLPEEARPSDQSRPRAVAIA